MSSSSLQMLWCTSIRAANKYSEFWVLSSMERLCTIRYLVHFGLSLNHLVPRFACQLNVALHNRVLEARWSRLFRTGKVRSRASCWQDGGHVLQLGPCAGEKCPRRNQTVSIEKYCLFVHFEVNYCVLRIPSKVHYTVKRLCNLKKNMRFIDLVPSGVIKWVC